MSDDLPARLRALRIMDDVYSDNPLGRDAAAEIERLRAVIAGYENGISWNTTKLSDAERLDAHAEGYFSRQKEVDDLKETIRRLENDCYKKCGVCEFDYGRAAPKEPQT